MFQRRTCIWRLIVFDKCQNFAKHSTPVPRPVLLAVQQQTMRGYMETSFKAPGVGFLGKPFSLWFFDDESLQAESDWVRTAVHAAGLTVVLQHKPFRVWFF